MEIFKGKNRLLRKDKLRIIMEDKKSGVVLMC